MSEWLPQFTFRTKTEEQITSEGREAYARGAGEEENPESEWCESWNFWYNGWNDAKAGGEDPKCLVCDGKGETMWNGVGMVECQDCDGEGYYYE